VLIEPDGFERARVTIPTPESTAPGRHVARRKFRRLITSDDHALTTIVTGDPAPLGNHQDSVGSGPST
jgi:hypothetical protein